MDLTFQDRKVHLPEELLLHICSFLSNPIDIHSARLVNKSYCRAATPLITNIWSSPAELFIEPDEANESEPGDVPTHEHRWVPDPFTVWIWLKVPTTIPLENGNTEVGSHFRRHICSPHDIEGQSNIHFKSYSYGEDGRKATSWSRMQERPEQFCIVMQWESFDFWMRYRRGRDARALREYLENIAPGCGKSSWSEHTRFPPEMHRRPSSLLGYQEVCTIYFPLGLSIDQKASIERTMSIKPPINRSPQCPGGSTWCWLPGLRKFNGKAAIAARWLFFWKTKALEDDYYQDYEARCSERDVSSRYDPIRQLDLFREKMQAVGTLGYDAFHANFNAGPWSN